MILIHKAAIERIVETSADEQMTSHEVCGIHALLSEICWAIRQLQDATEESRSASAAQHIAVAQLRFLPNSLKDLTNSRQSYKKR